MQRFFVDDNAIKDGKITITGYDASHISRVLRLDKGDKTVVCCNLTDYFCTIESSLKSEVVLNVDYTKENLNEAPIKITVYQGLPKSDKMDYIIQKCVELGAEKFVPVITKNCIIKIKDGDKKVLRWQKIASEAAKQCGRGIIPKVMPVAKFENAAKDAEGLKIIPYENEKTTGLKSILKNKDDLTDKISVFIGPEGGFDESEIILAKENKIVPVTLGPRILRTETAAAAVCAACMYELGDW